MSEDPQVEREREQRAEAGRLLDAAAEMFQYDVRNADWVRALVADLCAWGELDAGTPGHRTWSRRPRAYESDLSFIAVAAAREAFDRRDWDLLARVVMMSTQCAARFREWLDASGLLDEADAQPPLDLHVSRPTAQHA